MVVRFYIRNKKRLDLINDYCPVCGMKCTIKFFVKISFLFFLHNSHIYSVTLNSFVGLGGGGSSVVAVQNQFGWDFHIRGGFWTPFFDIGSSVGLVGVQSKTAPPIIGKKSSGVTIAGGSFQEVNDASFLYLLPMEIFFTGKFPVSELFLITGTFALGYLLDINIGDAFLDELGSTSSTKEAPIKRNPLETRDAVLFEGYSLMGLLGVEFNLTDFTVFLDGGYRYSEPKITTEVSEGDEFVSKTFKQNVSGFVIRTGIKFIL